MTSAPDLYRLRKEVETLKAEKDRIEAKFTDKCLELAYAEEEYLTQKASN